jgi:hypothetical protein
MKRILVLLPTLLLCGCAYLNSTTKHKTSSYYEGTNLVTCTVETTHGRAFTLLDANSTLTKFRNQSSTSYNGTNTYAPGTFASGINENSNTTNAAATINALTGLLQAVGVSAAK